jgi:thiamine biosynthesis lipoprotein ApbE/Na+-translocating ferredoxin:NAD+ oxidoreductase RnfG subunit
VTSEVLRLISEALRYAALSEGAFDPTTAPLVRLWGFGSGGSKVVPPEPTGIKETLTQVGFQNLEIDMAEGSLRKLRDGIELDPGAMGKGYAVDQAVRVLMEHGIERALVSCGSTTYALGSPPGRNGWRIGIQNPRKPGELLESILICHQAVSTSGDYERFFNYDGKRFPHILDPRTGYPVAGMAGATVISRTALEADILSTAAFVLGSESGKKFLESRFAAEGLLVSEDKKGRLNCAHTSGWPRDRVCSRAGAPLRRREFLKAFAAAIGWLIINPWIGYATVYLTPEEALGRLMPEGSKIRQETIKLTSMQKEEVEKLLGSGIREDSYTVWIGDKDEKPAAYAVVLDVIGKERPITFMVAVSSERKLSGLEVLVYRESQGSEIRSKRFMRQFIDKTIAAPLMIGRDIDSISGATLSSRSTAHAAKKALALVNVVYGGTQP